MLLVAPLELVQLFKAELQKVAVVDVVDSAEIAQFVLTPVGRDEQNQRRSTPGAQSGARGFPDVINGSVSIIVDARMTDRRTGRLVFWGTAEMPRSPAALLIFRKGAPKRAVGSIVKQMKKELR